MVSFVNGPAEGQQLMLRRAPMFLRVVQNHDGAWDALDQLADTVKAGETIYVYRLKAHHASMHLCRSPRSQSGWTQIADYEIYECPLTQRDLADNRRWQKWAHYESQKGDISND